MLEQGSDIRIIQALLGHSNIQTTAHYTGVSTRLIGQTHSPLDQLGPQVRPKNTGSSEKIVGGFGLGQLAK